MITSASPLLLIPHAIIGKIIYYIKKNNNSFIAILKL